MNFINLIGNSGIEIDTLVESPKESQKRKRKITMCGCGNHPVNPKKDVYAQHNNWVMQFHPKMESGRTNLYRIKGLNKKPYELKCDFSGDEFEITSTELREFGDESL